ncbi:MAG: hypothetical protein LBL13_00290 [Bacteroidales bacterium]|jgi:hypothetical protein|nr:hypothetical protein [Bacteroidales bacterium]
MLPELFQNLAVGSGILPESFQNLSAGSGMASEPFQNFAAGFGVVPESFQNLFEKIQIACRSCFQLSTAGQKRKQKYISKFSARFYTSSKHTLESVAKI